MTGIVLVTHHGLGECLLQQAEHILGHAARASAVSVRYDADIDQARGAVRVALARAADEHGLLVLTDLPGATPHNLAAEACAAMAAPLVSGVNLPMLLKVLNYADLPPATLADKAVSGGRACMEPR